MYLHKSTYTIWHVSAYHPFMHAMHACLNSSWEVYLLCVYITIRASC